MNNKYSLFEEKNMRVRLLDNLMIKYADDQQARQNIKFMGTKGTVARGISNEFSQVQKNMQISFYIVKHGDGLFCAILLDWFHN